MAFKESTSLRTASLLLKPEHIFDASHFRNHSGVNTVLPFSNGIKTKEQEEAARYKHGLHEYERKHGRWFEEPYLVFSAAASYS